jgi:hypothetical protein
MDFCSLVAATGEVLILALAVEDEALEEGAARGRWVRDAEGEERVVDGGVVAREVVGHGVQPVEKATRPRPARRAGSMPPPADRAPGRTG